MPPTCRRAWRSARMSSVFGSWAWTHGIHHLLPLSRGPGQPTRRQSRGLPAQAVAAARLARLVPDHFREECYDQCAAWGDDPRNEITGPAEARGRRAGRGVVPAFFCSGARWGRSLAPELRGQRLENDPCRSGAPEVGRLPGRALVARLLLPVFPVGAAGRSKEETSRPTWWP
jgi:hypothetical protein